MKNLTAEDIKKMSDLELIYQTLIILSKHTGSCHGLDRTEYDIMQMITVEVSERLEKDSNKELVQTPKLFSPDDTLDQGIELDTDFVKIKSAEIQEQLFKKYDGVPCGIPTGCLTRRRRDLIIKEFTDIGWKVSKSNPSYLSFSKPKPSKQKEK